MICLHLLPDLPYFMHDWLVAADEKERLADMRMKQESRLMSDCCHVN